MNITAVDCKVREVDISDNTEYTYKKETTPNKVLDIPEDIQLTFDLKIHVVSYEETSYAHYYIRGDWVKGSYDEWSLLGTEAFDPDSTEEEITRRIVNKVERTTWLYVTKYTPDDEDHPYHKKFKEYVISNKSSAKVTDWTTVEADA